MEIIGQERVIKIINKITKSKEKVAILLVAPSGYGKTLIGRYAAKLIAYYKGKKKILYSPTGEELEEIIRKKKVKYKKLKDYVVFIDEIHTVSQPEILFPIFEITDVVAATNIMGLPEALQNRFVMLPLSEYSDNELKYMFKFYLGKGKITDDELDNILKITRTPRKLKELAFLYRHLKKDFWGLVATPDGITVEEAEYLSTLKELGGKASFSRIKAALGYSAKYIQQIEVSLLRKGLIKITSKGRLLVNNNDKEDWI